MNAASRELPSNTGIGESLWREGRQSSRLNSISSTDEVARPRTSPAQPCGIFFSGSATRVLPLNHSSSSDFIPSRSIDVCCTGPRSSQAIKPTTLVVEYGRRGWNSRASVIM